MTSEPNRVSAAVAKVRTPSPAIGPIRLADVLDEFDLLRVEMPNLSRGKVFDWLESHGHLPPAMEEDQDLAGFLYVAGPVGVVFVRGDEFLPRKRFTAAHELGHFVLHRDAMQGRGWIDDHKDAKFDLSDAESDKHEREANRFAAELLMPADVCRARAAAVRKDFPEVPEAVLAHRLAADLLVSRQAMGFRLKELEVIRGDG